MNKRYCSRYISHRSWRVYTLGRLFLSTKDFDRLSYPSRSFTQGPKLLFTKSQQTRQGPTSPSDSPGAKVHASRQTIVNASSQHAHNADSSVSNPKAKNSTLNATASATQDAKQDPSPSSARGSNREKNTNKPGPPVSLSRSLPQSPFLKPGNEDEPPVKVRKRKPTKEDKDRLRRNPWAMALSSDVRLCSATSARLPKEFLLDWGLVRNPEAKNLWFMPKGLLVDVLRKSTKGDEEVEVPSPKEGSGDTGDGDGIPQPPKPARRPHPNEDIRAITQSPKFYLLNRAVVEKDLAAPPADANEQVSRLIPLRWKAPIGDLGSKEMRAAVWRQDMPDFVQGALRKEAVKALKRACMSEVGMVDATGVWSVVDIDGDVVDEKGLSDGLEQIGDLERMGFGGVVVLGSSETPEKDADVDEEVAGEEPTVQSAAPPSLPDMITLPVRGTQVPLLDLRALLTESDLEELRQHHPRFQKPALFFRPGENVPVDAMLALWKLKGHTMYDQGIY